MKIKKKNFFFFWGGGGSGGGGGGGWGVKVDLIEELRFLGKLTKKIGGGVGRGQVGGGVGLVGGGSGWM